MKPDAIDDELWDGIYDTYVADKNNLGVKQYFKDINPAAIQEMTAVMLETVRKGMWDASPEQIKAIADLHTEVVNEFGAACSGFVCDNAKLRDFIAQNVDKQRAADYNKQVAQVRAEAVSGDDGMVMKKEELNSQETVTNRISGILVAAGVIVALVVIAVIMRRRRRHSDEL